MFIYKDKFKHAFNGLKLALGETSFCIQLVAGIIIIGLGILFKISKMEWIVILLCIGAVLVAEIFNTAVENTCDLFSMGWILNEIKIIKDLAAAAVLIISIISFICGTIIFIPKILGVICSF
jgi:diacylglycerol kinase